MDRNSVNTRVLPIFLGLACLVPGGAGVYRAGDLLLKWDWALDYAATHVDNLPLFIHVIFAVTFIVLGAFQLLPRFRGRHPRWHRKSGRIVALSGIGGAMTGVWMTLNHPDISGPFLFYGRLIFSSLWAVFILLAVRAILMRQIARHRAFMPRLCHCDQRGHDTVFLPAVFGHLRRTGADRRRPVPGWWLVSQSCGCGMDHQAPAKNPFCTALLARNHVRTL